MTFGKLRELIERHRIPSDVHLMSDSGWECDETEMDGVYYNEKENVIIFTQEFDEYQKYHGKEGWVELL